METHSSILAWRFPWTLEPGGLGLQSMGLQRVRHDRATNTYFTDSSTKASLEASAGKEPACNAGDLGLIPGWKDPLEKEMATHFSILTCRIAQTKEPRGL